MDSVYAIHMSPSPTALAKFRYVKDPDDALDMAYEYDHDLDAQYEDYLTECHSDGVVPQPR